MKPATLLVLLTFAACAGQAHAKENCSVFTANFLGLEWTLENCELTPKINAWIAEERKRKEAERIQAEKEAAAAQGSAQK